MWTAIPFEPAVSMQLFCIGMYWFTSKKSSSFPCGIHIRPASHSCLCSAASRFSVFSPASTSATGRWMSTGRRAVEAWLTIHWCHERGTEDFKHRPRKRCPGAKTDAAQVGFRWVQDGTYWVHLGPKVFWTWSTFSSWKHTQRGVLSLSKTIVAYLEKLEIELGGFCHSPCVLGQKCYEVTSYTCKQADLEVIVHRNCLIHSHQKETIP